MLIVPLKTVIFGLLLLDSSQAMAYIGPGLGSGAVMATLGIVLGALMLFIGIIWYPLKKLIGKFKKPK